MAQQLGLGRWCRTALRRDIIVRSLKVSLVVGSVLAVINHGDALLDGGLAQATGVKILLTYLVPYSVATWSAVQTSLAAARDD